MERKVRVVQYGAGKMSRYLMRYVIEHGGELVGAFCRNKNHIGKDVAEIIGNGQKNRHHGEFGDAESKRTESKGGNVARNHLRRPKKTKRAR